MEQPDNPGNAYKPCIYWHISANQGRGKKIPHRGTMQRWARRCGFVGTCPSANCWGGFVLRRFHQAGRGEKKGDCRKKGARRYL